MDQKQEQRLRGYMKDCGCTPEQTEDYLRLAEQGCIKAQICLLKRHRAKVMETLHDVSRQVDRIDYVLYELEHAKENDYAVGWKNV